MIRTGIWRSPGWSCRRRIRAAGQLHRNLDGQGSAGEQHLGARGGPVRGVPLREYWPVPRRGSGHAGRPAVRRTQPGCPLRQASRIGTTSSGTDNPLAAASSVTENRREARRWRPVRPDRHSAQAARRLFSPQAQAAHRRAWPGRTRPRRCPLPRGHGRTRRAGTGCREPARLCAARADLNVLT